MIELFNNLPVELKKSISSYIDTVFVVYSMQEAAQRISEFANSCPQEEADFIDFYFKLKLEQLNNEDNSN